MPNGEAVETGGRQQHGAAFAAGLGICLAIGFISGRPAWEPRVRNYEINRQNTVLSYSRTSPIGLWDPKAVLAYSATEVRTRSARPKVSNRDHCSPPFSVPRSSPSMVATIPP